MLLQRSILLLEENAYLALDLTMAIEQMDGRVVGPTRRVDEAFSLLDSEPIGAAILDCHLPDQDIAPLARALAQRRVPFVFHAANECPAAIEAAHPDVPFLRKPLQPITVLAKLMVEIRRIAGGARLHQPETGYS